MKPSRFNPSSLTNEAYALLAVECAKRNAANDWVFRDSLVFAWSLVYTREMRLIDWAYEGSNLWC